MRILFVTATRFGDAFLSTGLLSHLIDRYPNAQITVAVGPAAATLFNAMPNLDRVIVLRKQRLSLHWLKLWRQCFFFQLGKGYWDCDVNKSWKRFPFTLFF